MQRGFFIFIAVLITTTGANAVSTRTVAAANRNGIATATTQTANPASGYTYNYMYPYLNNQMRTTLNPGVTTSQSTSPINAIVRTEQLSAPRRVVARPAPKNNTNATSGATNSNSARAATSTGITSTTQRRVVARPISQSQQNARSTTNATAARNVSRNQNPDTAQPSTGPVVTSARCLADYTECMNQYCERVDTTYNRCYCSAKLAQIDAEYQPKIDSLVKQIVGLAYGNTPTDDDELRDFWATTVSKYTSSDSWANIDDALDIDWASMESRVRGQNAFVTGHDYCVQHIAGCFYMASNLRDAYRSLIAQDCANYQANLERLKNVAESVIQGYQE